MEDRKYINYSFITNTIKDAYNLEEMNTEEVIKSITNTLSIYLSTVKEKYKTEGLICFMIYYSSFSNNKEEIERISLGINNNKILTQGDILTEVNLKDNINGLIEEVEEWIKH